MTTFHEYLRGRLETGGFSTEDALASFCRWFAKCLETHAAAASPRWKVLDALQVEGVRIWFEERAVGAAAAISAASSSSGNDRPAGRDRSSPRHAATTEVDEGEGHTTDLSIGDRASRSQRGRCIWPAT